MNSDDLSQHRLLVAIPCLNEADNLELLVRNLVASNSDIGQHIAIVDGGSTDGSVQIAQNLEREFPNVRLLRNPKRIQSAGLNHAVTEFGPTTDFLIRIDAHAEYPRDYCRELITEAGRTRADSVVVTMRTVGKTWFQKAVAAAQNSRLGNGGSAHRMRNVVGAWVDHGHHALMRIDAFRSVGGYDELLASNEDAELDVRLRKAGMRIWLTCKTHVVYFPRASPLRLFRQYFNYGSGRAATLLRHPASVRVRQLVVAAVAPAMLIALAAPFYGPLVLPVFFWVALCVVGGITSGIRTREFAGAFSGAAAMIMHMAWSFGFWGRCLAELWRGRTLAAPASSTRSER